MALDTYCCYADCPIIICHVQYFCAEFVTPSVVMLSAVMLLVVAPKGQA
jgi:hypothetical protein